MWPMTSDFLSPMEMYESLDSERTAGEITPHPCNNGRTIESAAHFLMRGVYTLFPSLSIGHSSIPYTQKAQYVQ